MIGLTSYPSPFVSPAKWTTKRGLVHRFKSTGMEKGVYSVFTPLGLAHRPGPHGVCAAMWLRSEVLKMGSKCWQGRKEAWISWWAGWGWGTAWGEVVKLEMEGMRLELVKSEVPEVWWRTVPKGNMKRHVMPKGLKLPLKRWWHEEQALCDEGSTRTGHAVVAAEVCWGRSFSRASCVTQ